MAVLTQEQIEYIRTKMIGVVDKLLVGRQILNPVNVDAGTQTYGYDKLSDMTDAEVIDKFSPGSKDMYSVGRNTVDIPILHKGFTVSRIDLMSSERTGESIKTVGLARSARKVAELEDSLTFVGDATYGIDGIEQIFGSTKAGAQVWSTAATETKNPYRDILNGITEMDYDPDFLVLDRTNYKEAMHKIPDQADTWMNMIKKDLIPNVFESGSITHGTAYMGLVGDDIADLIIAENYNVLDPNIDGQIVNTFDIINRVIPTFYEYGAVADKSEMFLKMTGL
jgi:uncharacterized linocin/CFP29 family protein